MVEYIRSLLSQWVLKEEREALAAQLAALKKQRDSLDARDLVLKRLKSYNPRRSKGRDFVSFLEENGEDVPAVLAEAHHLYKNKALKLLLEFLVDQQVKNIVRFANSPDEININRYSINGFELLQEEVEEAEAEYQRRHANEEDFNQFDVT